MSDKGGDNKSEIKDFESNTSAVEEAARARVEQAENDSIDRAFSEREAMKNAAAERENNYRAPSKFRLAILTIFGTLLGACFIFLVVLLAIKVGASDIFKEAPRKEEDASNEIFLLSYQETSLLYNAGDREDREDGSYLLEDYGLTDNATYLVITRMSQLENLQASFNKISGQESDFVNLLGIDNSFFDSGSIIAVSSENRYIGSLQTTKMSRNESYGLELKMKRTLIDESSFETKPQMMGYLNLIKVDNVQPRELTVFMDNN